MDEALIYPGIKADKRNQGAKIGAKNLRAHVYGEYSLRNCAIWRTLYNRAEVSRFSHQSSYFHGYLW